MKRIVTSLCFVTLLLSGCVTTPSPPNITTLPNGVPSNALSLYCDDSKKMFLSIRTVDGYGLAEHCRRKINAKCKKLGKSCFIYKNYITSFPNLARCYKGKIIVPHDGPSNMKLKDARFMKPFGACSKYKCVFPHPPAPNGFISACYKSIKGKSIIPKRVTVFYKYK